MYLTFILPGCPLRLNLFCEGGLAKRMKQCTTIIKPIEITIIHITWARFQCNYDTNCNCACLPSSISYWIITELLWIRVCVTKESFSALLKGCDTHDLDVPESKNVVGQMNLWITYNCSSFDLSIKYRLSCGVLQSWKPCPHIDLTSIVLR